MITFEKKIYLTKEGLERFRVEFESLRKLRLQKVKETENEDEVEFIDVKMNEIHDVLQSHELIVLPPRDKRDVAGLGARVTVESQGKEANFMIVGSLESNPPEGMISDESPVGRALLGKRVGDVVSVKRGGASVTYKIKEVGYGAQSKIREA